MADTTPQQAQTASWLPHHHHHHDQTPQTPNTLTRASLEAFLTTALRSGVNLGVVLEVLHLADYNLPRATLILALVAEAPPAGPALITSSPSAGNPDHNHNPNTSTSSPTAANPAPAPATTDAAPASSTFTTTTTTAPDNTTTSTRTATATGPSSVQASVGTLTASASAASAAGIAVVAVAPNSAGVAVGTAAGTSSSTAVPLSDVVGLPAGLTGVSIVSGEAGFGVLGVGGAEGEGEGKGADGTVESAARETEGEKENEAGKAGLSGAGAPKVPDRESSLRQGKRRSGASGTYVPAKQTVANMVEEE